MPVRLAGLASPDGQAVLAKGSVIKDALLFRDERHVRLPAAATEEGSLETAEGIAEYSGVKLGAATRAQQIRFAVYDLALFAVAPTFVRSFAYTTGQVESGGALVSKYIRQAVFSASPIKSGHLSGEGWHRALTNGWSIVHGERKSASSSSDRLQRDRRLSVTLVIAATATFGGPRV